MKKAGHGGCIVMVVLLLTPALGLGTWELLQRRRFDALAARLDTALEAFQNRTVAIEEGKALPTVSGRTTLPYFVLKQYSSESLELRTRTWVVSAVFLDSKRHWHPVRAEIDLEQKRRVLSGSPEIQVIWYDPTRLIPETELDRALADFTIVKVPGRPWFIPE